MSLIVGVGRRLCVNDSESDKDSDGNPFLSGSSKKDSSDSCPGSIENGLQLSDYQIIECDIRDDQFRTSVIFIKLIRGMDYKDKSVFPEPFPHVFSNYLDQLNAVISNLLAIDDASKRPCLDIDLQTNIVSPRVYFEVFPIKPNIETKNWQILDREALICDFNPQDVVHLRATLQHLPIGPKTDPIVTMLIQKMSTPMQKIDFKRAHKKLAQLRHYKICIEPGKVCRIKSYIR